MIQLFYIYIYIWIRIQKGNRFIADPIDIVRRCSNNEIVLFVFIYTFFPGMFGAEFFVRKFDWTLFPLFNIDLGSPWMFTFCAFSLNRILLIHYYINSGGWGKGAPDPPPDILGKCPSRFSRIKKTKKSGNRKRRGFFGGGSKIFPSNSPNLISEELLKNQFI